MKMEKLKVLEMKVADENIDTYIFYEGWKGERDAGGRDKKLVKYSYFLKVMKKGEEDNQMEEEVKMGKTIK